MSLTLRGPSGRMLWVYHVAATVGPWTLTSTTSARSTLTAEIASQDVYRLSQRPITFEVQKPKGRDWKWPVETLQVVGGTLTASLGPPEE